MNEYNFLAVHTVPADLICSICNKLIFDARISPCGCRYCKGCIEEHLSNGSDICPGKKSECEEEKLELDTNIWIDQVANRRVAKLIVWCPIKMCKYQDTITKVNEHVEICKKQSIKCTYYEFGCDYNNASGDDIKNHMESDKDRHINQLIIRIGEKEEENKNLRNEIFRLKKDLGAKQREKELMIKLEQEKKENLEKLKLMYKEDLVFTTEVSECPICGEEIPPGEAVVLRNCFHTICKGCIKEYITTIDNPEVKCFVPECVGFITHQELQGILNEEEFEKYQQLSLRTAESKTQNTFHCKTPNCTAWVVFDDGVNFFPCPLCKKENCLLCGAIHEGQTCKDYQDELAIKARNDEAAKKDMAFLQNLIDTGQAMKCPGCQIIVQKKSGCDWMQCNMCKTEICWATKGPRWGPKGKGDTSGGCQCRVKGRCHPQCKNCH